LSQETKATCIGVGLTCHCSINAPLLNVGNYNPANPAPTTAIGTVSVACNSVPLNTAVVSYNVTMSTGSSGTYASRTLMNGLRALQYNIYTTNAYTTVWGNTTGGTVAITDGYILLLHGGERRINYPCHVRINALQNVPPGTYTDTIIVTVTF